MLVSGGEGIGKSRLAVELMATLRGRDWDIGYLEPDATSASVAACYFRRKTLIVIENAARLPGGPWGIIGELLAKRCPLRVLLLEQFEPAWPETLLDSAQERLVARRGETLHLQGLTDSALSLIAPNATQTERQAADGRPLTLLLGLNPVREIARRVSERERLYDPS